MDLMCKLFRQNPESREGVIVTTSIIGILVNLLVAAVKVVIGLFASSIAVISEGVNNASDSLTSILMLVGTKLAGKMPDEKHPFGYGRIEYLTGLVIGVIILITGVELITNSIKLAFNPREMDVSYMIIIIVGVTAVAKFLLGIFTIRQGRKTESSGLEALGLDSRNDSFLSILTIVSILIYILTGISVDAYAGMLISLLIIKTGLDTLKDTVGDLLGRAGSAELAKKIYKEIRETEGIIYAVDMKLHNYGPEAWTGSVNVEIDHETTVGEAYQFIHALQLRIMHEYDVTMVFGIYAVDNDHEDSKALRKYISKFVKSHKHVKNFHAIYLEPDTDRIYCDLIVDYEIKNWDALREEFMSYMRKEYPDNDIMLTIETEFV